MFTRAWIYQALCFSNVNHCELSASFSFWRIQSQKKKSNHTLQPMLLLPHLHAIVCSGPTDSEISTAKHTHIPALEFAVKLLKCLERQNHSQMPIKKISCWQNQDTTKSIIKSAPHWFILKTRPYDVFFLMLKYYPIRSRGGGGNLFTYESWFYLLLIIILKSSFSFKF